MKDYLKQLEHSYKLIDDGHGSSRFEYIGDYVFNFTTYDGDVSELFAIKAIEVCNAISTNTTFDYIGNRNRENYYWYLLMVNMPFFAEKLEWGTSIRGAWWEQHIVYSSDGLFDDEDNQVLDMEFTQEEWKSFMAAVSAFLKLEV